MTKNEKQEKGKDGLPVEIERLVMGEKPIFEILNKNNLEEKICIFADGKITGQPQDFDIIFNRIASVTDYYEAVIKLKENP